MPAVTGRLRSAVNDIDLAALRPWVGRRESRTDVMDRSTARALAATLGHAPTRVSEGDELAPAWHWVYFTEAVPPERLGNDGHALRGGFLPPVELPRRLWAGGRLRFHAPLHIGDTARRDSTVAAIEDKTGRSGRLVFVSLRHQIHANGKLAIEEEQDLVYRAASSGRPATPRPPAGQPQWSRTLHPGPGPAVSLFRPDVQQPSYPLRQAVRIARGGLPGAGGTGPADGDTAARCAATADAPRKCRKLFLSRPATPV
ncbi:MAG: MaoC family dehydratase N-terminal domain-containing protein [Halioglobus sp.]|nr:MaoC family dehydratase N-terminal domain-containing protein [Halioglobus sp.]